MAPSTPPPPSRALFAALTTASTSRVVMSASSARIVGGIAAPLGLPTSGLQAVSAGVLDDRRPYFPLLVRSQGPGEPTRRLRRRGVRPRPASPARCSGEPGFSLRPGAALAMGPPAVRSRPIDRKRGGE